MLSIRCTNDRRLRVPNDLHVQLAVPAHTSPRWLFSKRGSGNVFMQSNAKAKGAMTISCMAILTGLFGYVPIGEVVFVPASALVNYSPRQIAWAKRCAAMNGVRYRITEN